MIVSNFPQGTSLLSLGIHSSAQQVDDAVARALPGGEIDATKMANCYGNLTCTDLLDWVSKQTVGGAFNLNPEVTTQNTPMPGVWLKGEFFVNAEGRESHTVFVSEIQEGRMWYNISRAYNSWLGWKLVPLLSDLHRPNLLTNPNFSVNQRGKKSYTGQGYCLDCWKVEDSYNSATVTVNLDGTITFAVPSGSGDQAWLTQFREEAFDGRQYTASAEVVSVSGNATIWMGDQGVPASVGITSLTGVPTGTVALRFAVPAGESVTVRRAKLELGPISTLANDPPPNKALELVKCQRYYLKTAVSRVVGTWAGGVTATVAVPLPVAMRTVPAITVNTLGVCCTSAKLIQHTAISVGACQTIC